MDKNKTYEKLKMWLSIAVLVLLGATSIIFAVLFIGGISGGLIKEYSTFLIIAVVTVVSALTIGAIACHLFGKDIVYKSVLITLVLIAFFSVVFFIAVKTGFWDRMGSIEGLRDYISSLGSWAVLVFIFIQILQVAVLPIPGLITIGAGVACFGAFIGGIYSFIGIMLGSVIAFYIGRKLGYNAAAWLVGKDDLDKGIQSVKGKDKVVLTFMFLFPFFPDDVLCFVAGLSSMSAPYFLIMITITRIISVFTTSYSLNGSMIPYDTWWGILLWVVLFLIVAAITVFIYKRGNDIEKFFTDKFSKKKSK